MTYRFRVRARLLKLAITTAAGVQLAACGAGGNSTPDDVTTGEQVVVPAGEMVAAAPSETVDSIFPMEVMIARFQAEAGAAPAGLRGAAQSRDELVAAFVAAVEDSSAAALRELRMDIAEYAYLYVPSSHLSRDPYRQPPAIGWMLTEQNGQKGETRLLRRFGGRSLGFRSYRCPEAAVTEGDNTLWRNCTIDVAVSEQPLRLFGTIIERAGAFKFISLANDL